MSKNELNKVTKTAEKGAVRMERDSFGEIAVPAERLWGAQTARSLHFFNIGTSATRMPLDIVRSIAVVKRSASIANMKCGKLDKKIGDAIVVAADKVLNANGEYDCEFPLSVWQTGSGTQTNMNVNEVIANICKKEGFDVHPNDHVNMSQSTNDVFPTALHMTAADGVKKMLLPAIEGLIAAFKKLEKDNEDIMKTGRTHLQDATPVKFSDEISAWRAAAEFSLSRIKCAYEDVLTLPIGGTAVGSGINTPKGYAAAIVKELNAYCGGEHVYKESDNKFHGLAFKNALASLHGELKVLATSLIKIANDVRWLASGPRAGIGEITIPANEPGSSIMPGKVNPTQCEALTMISAEVLGNDVTVSFAASQGNFELNVYMPVIGFKVCESITLLAGGIDSFVKNCVAGIVAETDKMHANLMSSLQLATALTPVIGYAKASEIVKIAHAEKANLKEIGVRLGYITAEKFDEIIKVAVKY